MSNAANDNAARRIAPMSLRSAVTATATVHNAVHAGDFSKARNAARVALRELCIVAPIPATGDRATWAAVLRVLDASVATAHQASILRRVAMA